MRRVETTRRGFEAAEFDEEGVHKFKVWHNNTQY
jgi:hypothetical protein